MTELVYISITVHPMISVPGAVLLAVPSTVETCLDHGVFRMNDDGTLKDIVYQGSPNELDRYLDEDRTKSQSLDCSAVDWFDLCPLLFNKSHF